MARRKSNRNPKKKEEASHAMQTIARAISRRCSLSTAAAVGGGLLR